jgi:hypothetical protein
MRPSVVSTRATVCPHGSVRAECTSSKPARRSSSPAAATSSSFATSNSMDAWGTTRSAGHCGVPKQACAASESGHTPKCLLPGTLPLE